MTEKVQNVWDHMVSEVRYHLFLFIERAVHTIERVRP